MTRLPNAVLVFLPFCDDPSCNKLIMPGSDFCPLHSGCSYDNCGDEVVEVLDEENGRCHTHRTTACCIDGCDEDAIDPGGPDPCVDYCPEHAHETAYEVAVDNGYRGPRYRRY